MLSILQKGRAVSRCLLLVTALTFVGCNAVSSAPTEPQVFTSTVTALLPTPDVTITPIPRSTLAPSPTTAAGVDSVPCPERVDEFGTSNEEVGFLILIDSNDHFIDRLYSLSLPDGEVEPFLTDLPRGYVERAITSRDGEWVAFIHEENDTDHAVSKRMVTTSVVQSASFIHSLAKSDWSLVLSHWTSDNGHIAAYAPFDEASMPGLRPDTMYLIDPFSNERVTITPKFSYRFDELWEYWRGLGGSVAYDSTMTRAVYLDDATTWVLVDTENSRELWRSYLFGVPYPAWSRDGSAFAFPIFINGEGGSRDPSLSVDQVGFTLIQRDGHATRTGPLFSVTSSIQFYGLSPDGHYIWFHIPDGPLKPGLYFWDVATARLIDCFAQSDFDPVWSPSGSQFAVKLSSQDDTTTSIHIVDLESWSYREIIRSQAAPIAWLASDK